MDKRTKGIFLSLGSNLGDRKSYLRKALVLLESSHLKIHSLSSVYESEAWGNSDLNDFLNLVVEIESDLDPINLLNHCQSIEQNLGRKSSQSLGYKNRCIDIDILCFGGMKQAASRLQLPHPHLAERKFVLLPWAEIAKDFMVTEWDTTVEDLLNKCEDPLPCQFHSKF